ncbi:DUF4232 domain-containing protein [Streptomyces sp. AM 4-1-1]|uniref:DUF4232 domain-containing protein n=1 Tax=Streptomyces sp. AM 4-1-1 TaxID=3028710 RepID=UPI0023B9ABB2|nr:DUF4232 domain-containing protein [Streptomyces sp. AM 4-1-1]WEH34082.1 DUF4232 domain-containing protein [Streptomyces sp. AM 4-1-1]
MRAFRLRRTARHAALGTIALVAALSLTACQEDDSATPKSSAPVADISAQPSADTSADPGSATPSAPADADKGKDTAGSGTGSGSNESGGVATRPVVDQGRSGGKKDSGVVTTACNGTNSKLSIARVSRPVNHMLLTLTNTGSQPCNAYLAPYLRFGEAQSVPPFVEDSKPQAVVTVAPGESAYAGVRTSSADGSGSNGYETKSLAVGFQGRNGGNSGSPVNVPMSKSVYVDDTLAVTYWQTEMSDALMY